MQQTQYRQCTKPNRHNVWPGSNILKGCQEPVLDDETACETVEFLDCKMNDFMPHDDMMLTRWTFFINEQNKVHHQSRVATDETSWDKPVCTHDTSWRQHYITTSKEYLTNGHILLKYFELVFLQLQLVKISRKLITTQLSWKNKKGAFYMKHRVYY